MTPPSPPPSKTRALFIDDHPATRRAERFSLTLAGAAPVEAAAETLRVGSKEGNQVVIKNETVSRYHFEIEPQPEGFLLRDLGSTNGTYVDNYRVREIYLPRRASIRAGECNFSFEALGESETIELSDDDRFGEALGRSPAMRELFGTLARVAQRDSTVLLEGESGTGKERLAEAIHQKSQRSKAPFVVFDCTAAPPSLIESELFGHERGAFTGAQTRRIGRFEEAHGGTLFIDELGELPLDLQPKLLRALEKREVRRLGGNTTIPVDVRVVAATNRDLAREVNRGAFREDLFYRLAVVRLRIPPLRERAVDLPLLVEHFIAEALDGDAAAIKDALAQITDGHWQNLASYSWPGNVRELRNFIERSIATGGPVAPDSGGARPAAAAPQLHAAVELDRPFIEARESLLSAFEKRYLEAQLARHDGNISRAARAAGLDRMHFKRLIARRRDGE